MAAILTDAAAREGFTFMLLTPQLATPADWERNTVSPPRPSIEAGREVNSPGWPQNRGRALQGGLLLLRAPLSRATLLALKTTGASLAGDTVGQDNTDNPGLPAHLELNRLESIRRQINAPPAGATQEEPQVQLPTVRAAQAGPEAEAEPESAELLEFWAGFVADADAKALEDADNDDGNGDEDAENTPGAEDAEAEARVRRSMSAVVDAAARSREMERGVPFPPPPLADQVAQFRAKALLQREQRAPAVAAVLQDFRSELAQQEQ